MESLVILGAGLAGLSVAYHAQKRAVDYVVFEAEYKVGGLCKTEETGGFLFDYSGHLLHLKDPYCAELIQELLKGKVHRVARNAAIYSHGTFTRYPFQANLYGLPPLIVKECLLGFIRAYYENKDTESSAYPTFSDWVMSKFGEGIGRHFMFPYNEKLWTLPTEELTCEWMGDYVPRPSLEDVIAGAISDSTKAFGYNSSFLYPDHGGIQSLATEFAARISPVRVGTSAVNVDVNQQMVSFDSGEKCRYGHLVSTLPLPSLVRILRGNVPHSVTEAAKLLRSNTVFAVNIGVRGTDLTDKHWVYIPNREITPYRVGVYSNFSDNMAPPGMSSYYVETAFADAAGQTEKSVYQNSLDLLLTMGFVKKRSDVTVVLTQRIECAYVLFDTRRAEARRTILSFLESINVSSIGRYGSWEYSGIEEAIMQGKGVIDTL
jgi:protoporphyrinogen oxidase